MRKDNSVKKGNRTNVVIHQSQREMIVPLIKKNEGNFSAAVRDCIEFIGFCIEKTGSLERAKKRLMEQETSLFKPGDKLLLNIEGITSVTFCTKKNSDGDKLELNIHGEIRSQDVGH
jgi:hypothetical protein